MSCGWKSFPPRRSSSKKSGRGWKPGCSEFVANVAAEKLNAQTQRGTVEERQKRLRELQEELERAAAAQDQVLEQQAEKRSRLQRAGAIAGRP